MTSYKGFGLMKYSILELYIYKKLENLKMRGVEFGSYLGLDRYKLIRVGGCNLSQAEICS